MSDTALVRAIERAALWAWPPRETRYLHGWLLRASSADMRRVNSVQVLDFAAPDRLPAAITEVARWYDVRGKPACFQLTELAQPPGLDTVLAGRGYARVAPVQVMIVEAAALPGSDAEAGVELLHRPDQAVLNAMAEASWSDRVRRERAALLARIRRPHRFGLVTVGGEPAAGGLVVVEGELAGLFALRTQPPFRRQGLGRRLVLALGAWAQAQGARRLYLQVEEANEPAQALYVALGFVRTYGYWYREAVEA